MNRLNAIKKIANQINDVCLNHPTRVAIDGVDASGKTILANELVEPLSQLGRYVIRASIDGFHNPSEVRRARGELSPEGYYYDSFNYRVLVDKLLKPLGSGGSRKYRRVVFDFRENAPVEGSMEEAPNDAVLLFDGVFLLREEIRSYWDFSVFVQADFEITLHRALQRDKGLFGNVENVETRYKQRYIPGQQLYLSDVDPESRVDVVLMNNIPDQPKLIQVK